MKTYWQWVNELSGKLVEHKEYNPLYHIGLAVIRQAQLDLKSKKWRRDAERFFKSQDALAWMEVTQTLDLWKGEVRHRP